MYVVPAARRRGIARALMNEVLEYCRAQGFRSVYVHASDAGRPLYESLGFIPTNEMRLDLRHD
jgi:GNAT superfamily N-acetyltransferase